MGKHDDATISLRDVVRITSPPQCKGCKGCKWRVGAVTGINVSGGTRTYDLDVCGNSGFLDAQIERIGRLPGPDGISPGQQVVVIRPSCTAGKCVTFTGGCAREHGVVTGRRNGRRELVVMGVDTRSGGACNFQCSFHEKDLAIDDTKIQEDAEIASYEKRIQDLEKNLAKEKERADEYSAKYWSTDPVANCVDKGIMYTEFSCTPADANFHNPGGGFPYLTRISFTFYGQEYKKEDFILTKKRK